MALFLVFRTYRNNRIDLSYFSAALWIGVASLISLKAAFFLIVIWLALLSLRPFYPREWLVTFLGFLTPWYLFAGIHLLLGHSPKELTETFLSGLLHPWPFSPLERESYLFAGYLLLLTLLASFSLFANLPLMKVRSRKFHMIFFWNAVIAVVLMIFPGKNPTAMAPYLALSLSMLFSYYFSAEKPSMKKRVLFDLYIVGITLLALLRMMK